VEKCCRAGQATDENTAHAHCILDIKGYKQTLGMYNINPLNAKLNPICPLLALFGTRSILHVSRQRVNCFSTAKIAARTRLSVTSLRTFPVLFILSVLLEDTAVLWHCRASLIFSNMSIDLYSLKFPVISPKS